MYIFIYCYRVFRKGVIMYIFLFIYTTSKRDSDYGSGC